MPRKHDPKTKAAWVRNLPYIPAKDVVMYAGKAAVTLTVAYVYNVRTAEQKKGPPPRPRTMYLGTGAWIGCGLVAEIGKIVERKVDAMLKTKLGDLS